MLLSAFHTSAPHRVTQDELQYAKTSHRNVCALWGRDLGKPVLLNPWVWLVCLFDDLYEILLESSVIFTSGGQVQNHILCVWSGI